MFSEGQEKKNRILEVASRNCVNIKTIKIQKTDQLWDDLLMFKHLLLDALRFSIKIFHIFMNKMNPQEKLRRKEIRLF